MIVFREKHATGDDHDHVALLAESCSRFHPVKQMLLRTHGLASHWSGSHDCYASGVAYGYTSSPTKPLLEVDYTPYLWSPPGREHPFLSQTSRLPVITPAPAARREKKRLARAEKGKAEAKFEEIDLWPLVVKENIHADANAPEKLMAFAKRCGGLAMVKFCWRHWDRLESLVARSWKVEKVEEHVAAHTKSPLELVDAALHAECACGGHWTPCATQLFAQNNINPAVWTSAVLYSLEHGRSKGTLICHAGLRGNEGKSFLLAPLPAVIGEDHGFTLTSKTAFPLMGLERCRVALLDDWRFNEDIIGYPLQLLWFEGQPIVIARPQNQYSGHLKYRGTAPIFITTLESDITKLKGK